VFNHFWQIFSLTSPFHLLLLYSCSEDGFLRKNTSFARAKSSDFTPFGARIAFSLSCKTCRHLCRDEFAQKPVRLSAKRTAALCGCLFLLTLPAAAQSATNGAGTSNPALPEPALPAACGFKLPR
jgi:hypothetical protein